MSRRLLDFEGIACVALRACPGLLWRWFPAGRVAGREFVVGNLRGDRGKSLVSAQAGAMMDWPCRVVRMAW